MIIGNEKQEDKIEKMGMIAAEMNPDVSKNALKGAFRWGVEAALEQHGLTDWKEAAARPARFRRAFFQSILDNAVSRLKGIGLTGDQIHSLKTRLVRENEKYTAD